MTWIVHRDLNYENGEKIFAEDLVLPILRKLLLDPSELYLQDIVGVEEWLKNEYPLLSYPAGIQVPTAHFNTMPSFQPVASIN